MMKTTPFRKAVSLLLALCMVSGLALGCTGCGAGGAGASAATMFLRKTEGTVAVADAEGADVAPAENLGLYSGYTVGTGAASYAWIDLDKVKLAKLDENSAAAITKDGKNLSIDVTSGGLFFNVTEPLADDETMEIRASSMIVGIRGTCGWVEVPEDGTMYLYLLEGKVECTAGENTAAVNAGEMAELTEDGEITVFAFTEQDVPDFVADEIEEDEALQKALDELPEEMPDGTPDGMQTEGVGGLTLNTGGFALDADEAAMYEAFLRYLSEERRVYDGHQAVYAELVDFEMDGSPELLAVSQFPTDSPMVSGLAVEIYRMEAGGMQLLTYELAPGTSGLQYASCSLVMRDGRPLVQLIGDADEPDLGEHSRWIDYYGSFAAQNGGPEAWVLTDHFAVLEDEDHPRVMLVSAHNGNGFVDSDTLNDNEQINDIGEQEALLGQYTLVRELYRRPFEG